VPPGWSGATTIAAGSSHSLALKDDGTVVGWGSNVDGQITIPTGLTGVTAISAGLRHSMALKSDGTVVAWGHNSNGIHPPPVHPRCGHLRDLNGNDVWDQDDEVLLK